MASPTNSVISERFLTALNDDETLSATCREITTEIQSGRTKLCTLVADLGPLVTHKDVSTREKGINALSSVLTHLPKDFLNEVELHLITSFYCDRLKDHHSLIPVVLQGILAIVQMHHLPQSSPVSLCRVLFEHVQCQSQLVQDRRKIYLIFMTLMENRIDALKTMGPDFIYGVISSVDGERDPKNLMLLFTILLPFMKKFSLGHLTEEMFEIIACYFPVDFNPSGSESTSITREDLAEKLAPCLCAIPEFAEFCLPLIIDKLFSNLKVAKLDSLSLLCKGAKVFGSKGLEQHLPELWSALRKEVMPGGDLELKNESLKAVMVVIEAISADEKLGESFIDKIITDTKSSLCDVQLSLFKPAEKLLESVAMVNKQSCVQVLRVIVPLCLGQYSTKTSLTDKVILLETLNSFIKISFDHGFNIKSVPELSWTDLPQVYLNELSTEHTGLKSQILLGLIAQKSYLNDVHRSLLYKEICSLIDTAGCDQIRTICHACMLAYATSYPREISTLIKERLHFNADEGKIEVQTRRLEALAAVAKTRELGIEVLPQIVSQAHATNSEISLTALTCLHRLIATKNVDFEIQHYLYNECNVIDKLTSCYLSSTNQRLDLISTICRLIVKCLTRGEQQEIVNKYATYLNTEITEVNAALIMNIFIPLQQNVNFNINQELLEKLMNFALNSTSANIRHTACKFIAVVLNKMNDDDQNFQKIVSCFKEKIVNNLKLNVPIETKEATVTLQIWLTKAIITKGSNNVQDFLNDLTSILRHDQVGQYLAHEYKFLTDKNEDALLEENFCNVKIFYKQRVFEHLIQRNHDFENASRQNFLIALVHLIEEVPAELLFIHLTKLVPLLIESLTLGHNEQLIYSTLTTLKILLDTKHDIFSDKAQCFIPRFLNLSTYKTMRVRIAALECLTSYCNYPVILINVYKQDVLEKLADTLDDRKRLVRKAATKARTQWFLVGAPGGFKEQ